MLHRSRTLRHNNNRRLNPIIQQGQWATPEKLQQNQSIQKITSVFYKIEACSLFYLHGLTLIPAWISNHIHYKVWDEITYPFLNFNGCTVEV